ncbi:redoxin domain-containing protein [Schlesneria sp. DSM 10557]|uniref:redoxin domain-containing protein n=1 Tax=Schlesneria sp. DSM 10557 TaxID=3044399 RepID=UPI0035A11689
MSRFCYLSPWMLCLGVFINVAGGEDRIALPGAGLTIPAFSLTDLSGNAVEVSPREKARLTVVCFLGTECPLARLYAPRLSQLEKEFSAQKEADRPLVRFIGVNSNSQDSQEEVSAFAKEYGVTFPLFKDPLNQVADLFGAKHMAEVFVLDEDFAVRYRGRIDDQYQPGVSRGQPTRQDLRVAIEELRDRKPVSVPQTETTGCLIGRVKIPKSPSPDQPVVTYCQEITRILNQHCVECHRPGEIAPFSLTDFEEVKGWGETILETIAAGRMPPWNANPEYGHFRNSRLMPESDQKRIREWVEAGMPYGDESQLPPPAEFRDGWQLSREPDLVLKMRDKPFKVPAIGTVEYQYFVVDPHFEEDRWVSGAQVIPGNRPTVHHCIVFVRPPDGTDVRGVGYVTGYVPGQRSFTMAPGYARRVPAGSKLVFQMHYTPNGAPQEDLTQIGLTFIPESEVTHEVFTLLGIDQEFEIPPHAADFAVHSSVSWFPKRAELLAIVPHMHVRGKAIQVAGRRGDSVQTLLDVPRYDFNWQHVYELTTPLKLDQLDELMFTAHFDNSAGNPANPDPSQTVTWGDQTWEEMAVTFFEVSEPRDSQQESEPQASKRKLIVKSASEKVNTQSVEQFVTDFFKRFDKNQDGVVEKHETPLGFRRYAFYQYDSDADGKLSREEIRSAAERGRPQR